MNLVIAAIVSGLVGLVSVPVAVGSFVGFAAVIYLRGYPVPRTPTLTKRYFPDGVLRWFDKESLPHYTVDPDTEDELKSSRRFSARAHWTSRMGPTT